MLPRGEILRGGDLVVASDGRVIEVVAAPESVLHVECASHAELARAAYHLGNRHVPVEIGDGFLRLAADHVLAEMLRGLDATVTAREAPFEPEAGAYGGAHHFHNEESRAARIHEYGNHEHDDTHDDEHEHCDHPHHQTLMSQPSDLARLLQLASPALPVGAYSYSQGLEAAVAACSVHDAASAQRWIGDVLATPVARFEAPVWLRLYDAWRAADFVAVAHWNATFLASRESAELRAETIQMGYSLAQLLVELGVHEIALEEIAFPTAFTRAVSEWRIEPRLGLVAYLWGWLENQVMAAVKVVPLGQTAGQRILFALGERLDAIAEDARSLADDELCNFAPGLALLSARHEAQYSRLFRS